MPHPQETLDVWSVEGRFQHLVYSPQGGIEGVLIDTDGVPTQFVFGRHDEGAASAFAGLQPGQALVIEGIEEEPSHKGEASHTVYRFERLASVDGHAPTPARIDEGIEGTVLRLNYARHGEANGVVLDTGDFVHTRPEGFARLGLTIGDKVRVEGPARPLAVGKGCVVEAVRINGQPCVPGKK
ncbi:hypothetical protein M2282_002957 [Variovorax boronicumulans]|uniref:hypothetical protein n=1 Tax=Variovorax boronicumulans TaxID=436515 RepID=UPI0024768E08|nr:hypothetical protein [Variovorax boronicumulans]MDH6167807.1 hypothetical protein [Variovorax boronicumulans]